MIRNKNTILQVIVLLGFTLISILLFRSVFKCQLSYRAMQAWKFKLQERALQAPYVENSRHVRFELPSIVFIPRDDPAKNPLSGFYNIGVDKSDAAKSFVYKADRIESKENEKRLQNTAAKNGTSTTPKTYMKEPSKKKSPPNLPGRIAEAPKDNQQRIQNSTRKNGNSETQEPHLKEAVQKKSSPNMEHPWVYHAPLNQTLRGKRLNVTSKLRSKLHIPITKFVTLSRDTWLDDIIFVTAASENHFEESLDTIGSIQQNIPTQKVLFYDLGLKPEQVKKVKLLCNVIYRPFNLSMYPPHFKNLGHCAWKPVIIHEVLLQHKAVFWVDSSVRILHSLSKFANLYGRLEKSNGIVVFSRASHTIFPSVHPKMFEYLPSNIQKVQESRAWQAGLEIIFKTEVVYNNILYWWTMCCLDPNCVSPILTKKCADKKFKNDKYNCHRFDQSALNIILHNFYNFDAKKFGYINSNEHISVQRGGKNAFSTKVCPKHY